MIKILLLGILSYFDIKKRDIPFQLILLFFIFCVFEYFLKKPTLSLELIPLFFLIFLYTIFGKIGIGDLFIISSISITFDFDDFVKILIFSFSFATIGAALYFIIIKKIRPTIWEILLCCTTLPLSFMLIKLNFPFILAIAIPVSFLLQSMETKIRKKIAKEIPPSKLKIGDILENGTLVMPWNLEKLRKKEKIKVIDDFFPFVPFLFLGVLLHG